MKNPLLDILFPQFCIGCGYVGTYVCPRCESQMKKTKRAHCFYCNKRSLLGFTHSKCKEKNGVDGYLSFYLYGGLFKTIIQTAKYKGAYEVLRSLLTQYPQPLIKTIYTWNALFKPTATSVPLHPQRLRERGFNQSDLIAQCFFNDSNFIKSALLSRKINTEHLANMGSKSIRKKHIKDSFAFIGKTIPKTVLLIDDVITSGSTILECSKTLKKNGVQTVLAFSLAKG